jgi:hypothetical protein
MQIGRATLPFLTHKIAVFTCFLLLIYGALFAHAHAQLLNQNIGISITSTPTDPPPLTDIKLTLDAYSVDQTGATIRWYVNGIERTEARNTRTLNLTTGPLGEKSSVRAVITLPNGTPVEATKIVQPVALDLIIEADSYIPSFYEGRALPSPGTNVRAVAVLHSSGVAATDLYYTWKLNDEILGGGAVKGRSATTFAVPRFGNPELSVIVTDVAGKRVAGRVIDLNLSSPEVHFYGINPLYGYNKNAIGDNYLLNNEEVTLSAEPYYTLTSLIEDEEAMVWKIDNKAIPSQESENNRVTLRKTGGSGSSLIDFKITDNTILQQRAEGAFTIVFGES